MVEPALAWQPFVRELSLCRIQREPILEPEVEKKVAIRSHHAGRLAHKGEMSGGSSYFVDQFVERKP